MALLCGVAAQAFPLNGAGKSLLLQREDRQAYFACKPRWACCARQLSRPTVPAHLAPLPSGTACLPARRSTAVPHQPSRSQQLINGLWEVLMGLDAALQRHFRRLWRSTTCELIGSTSGAIYKMVSHAHLMGQAAAAAAQMQRHLRKQLCYSSCARGWLHWRQSCRGRGPQLVI